MEEETFTLLTLMGKMAKRLKAISDTIDERMIKYNYFLDKDMIIRLPEYCSPELKSKIIELIKSETSEEDYNTYKLQNDEELKALHESIDELTSNCEESFVDYDLYKDKETLPGLLASYHEAIDSIATQVEYNLENIIEVLEELKSNDYLESQLFQGWG